MGRKDFHGLDVNCDHDPEGAMGCPGALARHPRWGKTPSSRDISQRTGASPRKARVLPKSDTEEPHVSRQKSVSDVVLGALAC